MDSTVIRTTFVPKIVNFLILLTVAQPVHFSSIFSLSCNRSYAPWLLLHVMKCDLFINYKQTLESNTKKKIWQENSYIVKLRFQFTSAATITVCIGQLILNWWIVSLSLYLSLSHSCVCVCGFIVMAICYRSLFQFRQNKTNFFFQSEWSKQKIKMSDRIIVGN